MTKKITIGSFWSSGLKMFEVVSVARTPDETWITYKNVNDPSQIYSCLQEAFLQRFKENINFNH
jgi:hypothetical protein